MNITRDVIRDLLPVYFSGDASPDTSALIEAYLRKDPEFACAVEAQRREFSAQPDLLAPVGELSPDLELETLRRTRAEIGRQKWLMAIALMLTAFPFSFAASDSRLEFMVLRDQPVLAAVAWIGALILWIQYFLARLRMKASGLLTQTRKGDRA